jgi:hypothetical protein
MVWSFEGKKDSVLFFQKKADGFFAASLQVLNRVL